MTLHEVHNSPNGTMTIIVRENDYWLTRETQFIATRYEKVSGAVRPRDFYGETAEIAWAKADKYDKRRKELHAKWKHNYQKRRDRVTG